MKLVGVIVGFFIPIIVGVIVIRISNAAPNRINLSEQALPPVTNSAVFLTRALDVQNVDHFCKGTAKATKDICATPTPAAWCATSAPAGYVPGEWVTYIPSASSNGGASLNVNNCGTAGIKLADGLTDPGDRLRAGQIYHLDQDGTVWRMTAGDSALQ